MKKIFNYSYMSNLSKNQNFFKLEILLNNYSTTNSD